MNLLITVFILVVLLVTGIFWTLPFIQSHEWGAVGFIAFLLYGFASLLLSSKN